MQSFRAFFNELLEDSDFKNFYEKECHICSNTIRIFATLFEESMSLESLGRQLGLDVVGLRLLLDGDYCDPHVVAKVCRHLGLRVPDNCPRMSEPQGE